MQLYIQNTIDKITQEITKLQTARTALVQLVDPSLVPVAALAPVAMAEPRTSPPVASQKRVTPKVNKKPAVGITLVAAIRQVISKWSGEFKTAQVRDQIVQRYPELSTKANNGMTVTLKFLAAKNEVAVVRKDGAVIIYRRVAAKSPAESAAQAIHKEIRAEIEASKTTEE
jgi:hypothetical protein